VDVSISYKGMFIILQLNQHQGDVWKQDNELCTFGYFPVTIARKEEGKFCL
jgi:hypothetical protein